MQRALPLLLALLASSPAALAQSNAVPGTDAELAYMSLIDTVGRGGVFPNGTNALSSSTTVCNKGTEEIAWFAPMNADHPVITFLVARETDGRLIQISTPGYAKHVFAALASSQCDPCTPPAGGGTMLGVGCSDTYGVTTNASHYWLGPLDEIDPWTGLWDPVCSHFDRGEPAVAPPNDCDGQRSLSFGQASALDPLGHRVLVSDADLDAPGSFWIQGYFMIPREPEADRGNNLSTRGFTPIWVGAAGGWVISDTHALAHGTVLTRWSGATVSSAVNGGADGRVYVAAKVIPLGDGMRRYEYALHNRDNQGGIGALRIPVCSGARVENVGFHDVDGDPGSDWAVTIGGGEIAFETTVNPLTWNNVYNFWFDSDALPDASGTVTLDQLTLSPGAAPSIDAAIAVPGRLPNVFLGDGCASGPDAPTLYAVGSPAQATLGNASFGIESTGNASGQPALLYKSKLDGSFPVGACTVYLGGILGAGITPLGNPVATDGTGRAHWNAPVPTNAALEGQHLNLQAFVVRAGGPLFGVADLTDALRVRIGDLVPDCP